MKTKKACAAALVTIGVVCIAASVRADVKLPAIFGDHMVVQRGIKVPVWGSAEPGEKVTVKTGSQKQSATADKTGNWRIALEPIEARDPIEITVAGTNTIALKDVLVGDAWLCSGQSNMAFALKRSSNGAEATTSADRPKIRLFNVERVHKDRPQDDVKGAWQVCTPETAADFSAVAYFFGSALQDKLDVPIGLIESDWGGTRAEAWLPRETFDALKLPYEPAWTETWLHPKPDPKATEPVRERPYEAPAVIYNGMIAPIAGFALRGAVWYQGETNTAYPVEYRRVLGALITSWRAAWGQGDFPVLVVQLPNFKGPTRDWVAFRSSQAQVAKDLPNVGLAVTIDIGDPKDIHPTNKQPVGTRLAALALKMAYGQDVPYSGPTYKSMRIDGSKAVVTFDHVHGGLVSKGELLGFEIAGTDGKFVPAMAKVNGETVVLSADGVKAPESVRYGWANDPTCTLYNQADLPAAPFSAKP